MRDKTQRRGRGHAQRRRELYAADQAQREALARRDVAQRAAYKGVMLTMAKNTATARSALKEAHRTIARLQREAQREATLRQDLESSLRRRHPAAWEIKGMHHVLDRETWRMRRDERFGQAYRDIQQKVRELKAERVELKKRLRADGRRPGPARRGVTAEGRCSEICYTVEPRDTPADVCGALETLALERQGLKRKVQRAAALSLVLLVSAARRGLLRRDRTKRAVRCLKCLQEGMEMVRRHLDGGGGWAPQVIANVIARREAARRLSGARKIERWVFNWTWNRRRRVFQTMRDRYRSTPRWKLDLLWLRRNDGTTVRDEDARREGSVRAAFAEAFGRLVQLEFQLETVMKERSTAFKWHAAEHEGDSPPQSNKRQKTVQRQKQADFERTSAGDTTRGRQSAGDVDGIVWLDDIESWAHGRGAVDICLSHDWYFEQENRGADVQWLGLGDSDSLTQDSDADDTGSGSDDFADETNLDEDTCAFDGGQDTGYKNLRELLWFMLCVTLWSILCATQFFGTQGAGATCRAARRRELRLERKRRLQVERMAEDVDGSGRRGENTVRRREADRRGRAGTGNAGP